MSGEQAKKRKLSEENGAAASERPGPVKMHIQCPYLDTINRHVLDFDFEKLCSVSLTRINVYACLVCGKYFQGRGTNTHAYTHSVADGHHVFLNLHTLKFYCLPDNYEVIDSSLNDIKYVLNPIFTEEQIVQLDTDTKMSRAIDGTMYMPGIVGLNNIKANDYCNVILQCLAQVRPLRNYFLREENYANVKRPPGDSSFLLVQRFGELLRKLWNPRAFKAHVSPHEMLQAVVLWSKKKFQFIKQKNYANVKRPPGDSSFLLVQRFGEHLRKLWNPRAFKAHVSPHEMLQAVVLWSKKKSQFIKQMQRFGELLRKLWNPRAFKAHVSPHEMLQAVVLWSKKKFQFIKQSTYRFGELLRKLWNPRAFKAHVSPHEMLQAVVLWSKKKFQFIKQSRRPVIKLVPPLGDSCFLLIQRFGELLRKLWNPRAFKAHVSPHEMLQAVVLWSKKKFQFIKQSDPIDFLSWFLNSLHMALNGTKKPNSSVIYKSFLGHMRIYTRKLPPADGDEVAKVDLNSDEYQEMITESPFLYLTCDLPPTPLFTDEFRENIIPQVNLYQLLSKFNGQTSKEYKTYKENFLKRFEITQLPPYLILYIKRFTKNTFFVEKNPTVVNFPVKNVDFGDILTPEIKAKHKGKSVYELVGNIVHDGTPEKGTYRAHVLHKPTQQWYEMQDLHVTSILPQMITLTEAYIQIYELQKD
ncbi:ubiquitin carboxyl-terminal hydrolase domain-containing protein [Phthorimaea operculella]|nr:ubiquitin carboxyl-terminal hydrolase domain-containing protein [Phthorimaea operculella]